MNIIRRMLLLLGASVFAEASTAVAQGLPQLAEELDQLGYFSDLPASDATALKRKISQQDSTAVIEYPYRMAMVDAEDLAEGMIGDWLAQDDMQALLKSRQIALGPVADHYLDTGYTIDVAGKRYTVHSQADLENPNEADPGGWGRALYVAVSIVNELLEAKGAQERLYTLHAGGNDGFVWLLTAAQAEAIQRLGKEPLVDLPIKMTDTPPYYGLPH